MPRSKIYRTFNIPEVIIAEAERHGLDACATGGGLDYICKRVGTNTDGSHRTALLCNADDAGTPDRLSDRAFVQVMLSEDWTEAVAIQCKTAREGMDLMVKMFDPYNQK